LCVGRCMYGRACCDVTLGLLLAPRHSTGTPHLPSHTPHIHASRMPSSSELPAAVLLSRSRGGSPPHTSHATPSHQHTTTRDTQHLTSPHLHLPPPRACNTPQSIHAPAFGPREGHRAHYHTTVSHTRHSCGCNGGTVNTGAHTPSLHLFHSHAPPHRRPTFYPRSGCVWVQVGGGRRRRVRAHVPPGPHECASAVFPLFCACAPCTLSRAPTTSLAPAPRWGVGPGVVAWCVRGACGGAVAQLSHTTTRYRIAAVVLRRLRGQATPMLLHARAVGLAHGVCMT